MAKKNNENRVVYAALILVLTVLSVLVIATGIASRRNNNNKETDTITESDSTALDAGNIIPEKPKDTTADTVKREEPTETDAPDTQKPTDVIATEDAEDVIAEPEPPEFISPIDGVVSKEHSESVLVYSLTMGDYRTHSGIDIATSLGAYVKAVADGVVEEVWEDPMWGYCISVSHEGDAVSYYKNLSRESILAVSTGDKVKAGDIIATVGDSALMETADEAHLHFELKVSGLNVDPCDYFEVTGSDDVNAE